MSTRNRPSPDASGSLESAQQKLLARARAARRRGDIRAAIVALREACLRDERAAAAWTMYGAMLARARHSDEAVRALRHALWLRKHAGDEARAHTTQILLERVELPHAA